MDFPAFSATFFLIILGVISRASAADLVRCTLSLSANNSSSSSSSTLGDVSVDLNYDATPVTSENFRVLCTGEKSADGVRGYAGTRLHRIVPGFVVQGGDVVSGDGEGQQSIYGDKYFDDENFDLEHEDYVLSMANEGPDTNGSQFFITFKAVPRLNGKHVVFGSVAEDDGGSSRVVVDSLQRYGSESGKVEGAEVTVDGCACQNHPEE